MKPSDEASIKLNVVWGLSDTAKGKCSGSSLLVNMVGEVSEEQKEESRIEKWPYSACRAQTNDKLSVSYSEACYQASRELSTLRKYQVFIRAENVSEIIITNHKNKMYQEFFILIIKCLCCK